MNWKKVVLTLLWPVVFTNAVADDLSEWNFHRDIYMNTSQDGAGVTENVMNFPVLITLNSSNFSFEQAAGNGADIRFAKSDDSTELSYEIEEWDSIAQTAAVWVLVDTITEDDSTQYIRMYWGKSGAISESSPSSVFGTSHSFTGVWHLNQDPSSGSIDDATTNGYDLTMFGNMQSTDLVSGKISQGIDFKGTDDVLRRNVQAVSSYPFTVSCWVKTGDGGHQTAFFIGDSSTYYQYYGLMKQKESGQPPCKAKITTRNWSGEYLAHGNTGVDDGNWHYLTCVFESDTRKLLYEDGDSVDMVTDTVSFVSGMNRMAIGALDRDVPTSWFVGTIDEARLEAAGRNPAWIKLCYENQKENQTLVELGEIQGFHVLAVSTNGGGQTQPSGDTTVLHGDTVEISALPSEDYVFSHWSVDSGMATIQDSLDSITAVILPVGNARIAAHFAAVPHGLTGIYYDNLFGGLQDTFSRIDTTVNFNWSGSSPDPSMDENTYRVVWIGQVNPEFTETYTFYVNTDDGVRLWVDGTVLVNNWVDQSATQRSGSIALTGNTKYDIMMEYYQRGGGAVAELSWGSSSVSKQIIPSASLYALGYTGDLPVGCIVDPSFSRDGIAPIYKDVVALDFQLLDSAGVQMKVLSSSGVLLTIDDASNTKVPGAYRYIWNGTVDNTFGGALVTPGEDHRLEVYAKRPGGALLEIADTKIIIPALPQ